MIVTQYNTVVDYSTIITNARQGTVHVLVLPFVVLMCLPSSPRELRRLNNSWNKFVRHTTMSIKKTKGRTREALNAASPYLGFPESRDSTSNSIANGSDQHGEITHEWQDPGSQRQLCLQYQFHPPVHLLRSACQQ